MPSPHHLFPTLRDRRRSGPRSGPLCWLIAALLAISLGGGAANAVQMSDTWLGGFGMWTGGPWSLPFYPTNGGMGFPPGTTFNVFIDGGSPAISDVSLDIGVIIDNLSITSGDTLEVTSGGGAVLKTYATAGTLSNAGTIKLEKTGASGASITFDGTGVAGIPMPTLTGGGIVTMTGGTTISGMPGPASSPTLTSDNTIMGAGLISGLNLINHGTIDASFDPTTPMPMLTISPPGTIGTVKNIGVADPMMPPGTRKAGSGLLEATMGATLALNIGVFDNTDPSFPGMISAMGGSKISLGSTGGGTTVVKGGTLSSMAGDPGSYVINVKIATLNGVTLAPGTKYLQGDFTQTNLEGAITNGGSITLSSGGIGGPADMSVLALDSADVTLSGTGSIALAGFETGMPTLPNLVQIQGYAGPAGAPRLTIGAGQTIIGSGQIGTHSTVLSPKLTNHGTITATTVPPGAMPAQGITVFPLILPAPPIADAVINDGTMQALDNAYLTFNNGIVTNTSSGVDGTIAAHGMMMPSKLILQAGVEVDGGIVLVDGPLAQLQVTGAPAAVNSVINGAKVSLTAAGGMIKLNNGTIHAGTLTNIAGGLISTVNGSKSNRLGGIVHNPMGATILVDTNSNLELETGATYDNPGTIFLNGAPPNLSLLRPNGFGAGGNVTLTGGGSVILGGDSVSNEISGVTGNERLVNVDNTISGGGKIGNLFGMISLTNKATGTIQATTGTITIEPNADGVTNGGLIQTMGANLNLTKIPANDAAHGVFTNIDGATKGTIRAAFGNTVYLNGPAAANNAVIDNGFVQVIPGSTLQLSNGTIHNGILTNFGVGSLIQTDPAGGTTNTLGGTVNNNVGAVITVNAGSTLNLETGGTYMNAGTINVNDLAGMNTNLCPNGANGAVTLDGSGMVNLLGAGTSIFGVTGTETLVNLNNTIAGGGMIGAGKMALINRGTINANNNGADLTIQPNATGVTNSGTIQTAGGDLILMGGNYANFEGATNGLIRSDGDTITINGNAMIDGGDVDTVNGGTINLSNATIHNGTLTNNASGVILSTMNTTNTLGGTVNNLAGGLISVARSTLKLETGGTYNNAGLLRINGGGAANPSRLMLDGAGGTVTLSGGGILNMSQAGGNSISGVNGNERLINLDNTINGVGQIGLGMMSLTNDGTIDANTIGPNMADGLGITITPNAGGVINGGILQASNGAKLTLNGGVYTNTTGIIQALGMGSEVDLQTGVTINGGSLGSSTQSLIRVVDEAVLNTVTNNDNVAQNEGSILDLIGTITNNGTITMPATNFVTQIKLLNGNVTLGGTGTVTLMHSPLNQIIAANGLDRLTVGPSQMIRGTGNIGVGSLALTNNGTIIADQPTALTIQPNALGFLNTGTLRAAAGSTLNVIGGYAQTAGDTNVLGTLNVTSGPLTAGGGTLSGAGQSNISGGFSLTGNFTKLDSGTATISGPENFNSGTTLAINGGTVKFNVNSGPVTVGSSVTATVASGAQLELAGTVSAFAAGSGRVNVGNSSSTPGLLVSGKNQQVGGVDGSGAVAVNGGSDLTANHIVQTSLMIGGTAAGAGAVTIAPSDASGNPMVSLTASASSLAVMAGEPAGPFAIGDVNVAIPMALPDEGGNSGPAQFAAMVPEAPIGGVAAVVPEPTTWLLLVLGIGCLALARRR